MQYNKVINYIFQENFMVAIPGILIIYLLNLWLEYFP